MRKVEIKQYVNNLGSQLAALESAAGLKAIKDGIDSFQQAMTSLHQETKSTATEADLASILELIDALKVAKRMLKKSDGYTASLRFWLNRWYQSFSNEFSICIPLQVPQEKVLKINWQDELTHLQHNINSLSYLLETIPVDDLALIQQLEGVKALLARMFCNAELISSTLSIPVEDFVEDIKLMNSQLQVILGKLDIPLALSTHINFQTIKLDVFLTDLQTLMPMIHEFELQCQSLALLDKQEDRKFSAQSSVSTEPHDNSDQAQKSRLKVDEKEMPMRKSRCTFSLLMHDSYYNNFDKPHATRLQQELFSLSQLGGVAAFTFRPADNLYQFFYNLKEEVCDKRCRLNAKQKNKLLTELDMAQTHLEKVYLTRSQQQEDYSYVIDLDEALKNTASPRISRDQDNRPSYLLYQFFTNEHTKVYLTIDEKLRDELTEGYMQQRSFDSLSAELSETIASMHRLEDELDNFTARKSIPAAEAIMLHIAELELEMVREAYSLTAYKKLCLHYASVTQHLQQFLPQLKVALNAITNNKEKKKDMRRLAKVGRDFAGLRLHTNTMVCAKTMKDFIRLTKDNDQGYRRAKGKSEVESSVMETLCHLSSLSDTQNQSKLREKLRLLQMKWLNFFGRREMLLESELTKENLKSISRSFVR
jgi:hypothetical protein